MATTSKICKVDVLNSLSMFNTVGQELIQIFKANDIINGEKSMSVIDLEKKERLNKKQLNQACEILNLGEELKNYLINFQNEYADKKKKCKEQYLKSKKNYTRLKSILPLLKGEYTDGIDILDDILDFFNVDSEDEIFIDSNKIACLFRQQNNVEVDPIALKGWLRRGELEFNKMELPEYNKFDFIQWIDKKDWLNHIQDVQYFLNLYSILKPFGIGLVYVPFLPKTVYGAVRWFNNRPLIEISDRNQDLATCWFTLFHEFGHVIKHENESILEGEINESKSKKDKREREANSFANHYLFNGDELRKEIFSKRRNNECINDDNLSKKYAVNKLFVSYWLRKAQIQPSFQKKIHIDFITDEYKYV